MIVRNEKDLIGLRKSGALLRDILDEIEKIIRPGVSTNDLNTKTLELITDSGAKPAFLNYKPYGAKRPYPAALCTSVNDAVVHGIPNEDDLILKEGDIITIDTGISLNGYFTDSARTIAVGNVSSEIIRLINAAKEARAAQIKAAVAGNTTGDLGYATEQVIKKYGYDAPEILGGHGVGRAVHEEPFVPNFGKPNEGDVLQEGEVLALEPIVVMGNAKVFLDADGYTYRTKDGSLSAQFEHTVIVGKGKAEILT